MPRKRSLEEATRPAKRRSTRLICYWDCLPRDIASLIFDYLALPDLIAWIRTAKATERSLRMHHPRLWEEVTWAMPRLRPRSLVQRSYFYYYHLLDAMILNRYHKSLDFLIGLKDRLPDWIPLDRIVSRAIALGARDVAKRWIRCDVRCNGIMEALQLADLEMIEFFDDLTDRGQYEQLWPASYIEAAARSGNVPVVERAFSRVTSTQLGPQTLRCEPYGALKCAAVEAADRGHLDVLEWIFRHPIWKTADYRMDLFRHLVRDIYGLCLGNHGGLLETLERISEIPIEGNLVTELMVGAVKSTDLTAVRFLERKGGVLTVDMMKKCPRYRRGYVDLLRYWQDKRYRFRHRPGSD